MAVKKATLKSLAEATAEGFQVSYRDLMGKHMKGYIIKPRHSFFYIAHKKAGHSLSDIGRFTGKCHTTVLYGTRKMKHQVSRRVSDAIIDRAQELDAQKKETIRKLVEEGWK